MLDEGVYSTIEDLVRAKGVAPSYVSRVLRLTMRAPEIVEAILDGRSRRISTWMISGRVFLLSGGGRASGFVP
jgi:hypothetical protein